MNEEGRLLLRRLGIILIVFIVGSFVAAGVFSQLTSQLGSLIFALFVGGIGANLSLVRRIPSAPSIFE